MTKSMEEELNKTKSSMDAEIDEQELNG